MPASGTAAEGATSKFFGELARRGHEPALAGASGALRFDVRGPDGRVGRWLVTLHRGDLAVSRGNNRADCVVRADSALFDELVSGRANALAAMLRGAIHVEGELGLLVLFQRLFPAPPQRRPSARRRT